RRVQVFRLPVAKHAAAESDDAPFAVTDREDHAVAEIIEAVAAAFGAPQQPGFDQQRFGEILAQRAFERVAALRRIAQAKAADRREVEAAALEILPRLAALRPVQRRFEKGAGG